VHRAPGIPCALCFRRGETVCKTRAKSRREIAESYLNLECRHCEERSDEAIHSSLCAAPWIASLALATTVSRRAPHLQPSSPGLTGRPSIPQASVIEPRSRGVRDTAFAGYDGRWWRRHPSFVVIARSEATKQSILSWRGQMDCVACARNDGEVAAPRVARKGEAWWGRKF
jgi:hypothetical protein